MMTRLPSLGRADRQLLSTTVVVAAVAYVVGVTASMGRVSYDVWAALWLVPVLFGGSLLLLRRLNPCAGTASLVPLLSTALAAKAAGTVVRYVVIFSVYDGTADASTYHNYGTVLAQQYRRGDFDVVLGPGSTSTGFMKIVTGLVYTVTGPSRIGGFAVFATASFWGLYLAFRAFQIALPAGDAKRYAVLIFFLPSMLFWPSSIGKEAWMTLALGLTAYGAARIFRHRRNAYPPLLLGLAASSVVRPHVAVVVTAALLAGFLLRPRRGRSLLGGGFGKIIGIAVLAAVAVIAAQRMQDALNLGSSSSFNEALDFAQERTNEGGSSFEAARIHSPADVPWAAVTVLFRPFPFEAGNAQAMVSALEGLVLMGLFVLWARQLTRVPRLARRNPYVAFAFMYSIIFVFAFSTFGNFGIITRQRVQLFPFVLVLLCLGSTAIRPSKAPRQTVYTR
ncbi:MAG TPA: hypothetical protein VM282_22530 [Acidimicrobiales bacterium]|nr:hypothetical protein [Acidimicrobiales bacterium]